jgi:phage baseplate assembly protein W
MSTLAVKLPITRDEINGYAMIDDIATLIKQNFKMLILTNPGERVMIPDFGVGIRAYLFENFNSSVESDISVSIRKQTQKYLPVISIKSISFNDTDPEFNTLSVKIRYSIPALNIKDLLEFTI